MQAPGGLWLQPSRLIICQHNQKLRWQAASFAGSLLSQMYSSKIMKLAVVFRFMDVCLISVSLVIFRPFEMGCARGLICRAILAWACHTWKCPASKMVSKQRIRTTASHPPLHPSLPSLVSQRQRGLGTQWLEVKMKMATVKLTTNGFVKQGLENGWQLAHFFHFCKYRSND